MVLRSLISADSVVTSAGQQGDAILVEDGRVAAIGKRDCLHATDIPEARFSGSTIIPGLRDAHLHAVPYAALLDGCSLKAASDIEDLQARLRVYAASLPDDQPVVATRLDDEGLAEQRLPTRFELDDAVLDRPTVIYRYCGHIAVANTAALSSSGITADSPDPEGGTIDRGIDGSPTGVLRETAMGLIQGSLARGTSLSETQLLEALTRLAGLGLTSIGAMIGYGERPFEQVEAELELWQGVAPHLPIRVNAYVITDSPEGLEQAATILGSCGDRLGWLGVKRFSDGSLGGHTAAMHDAFSDVPTTGTYRLTEADVAVSRMSLDLGGMVAIHAIGDRAVDGVLDTFEELIHGGANPHDLRMEHASVMNPDQIGRMAALGTTAVIQPAFLASEYEWLGDRVGKERMGWVYPFRSMQSAGIPLAGSSDCPVEPPHPLWGMAAAMDRYGFNAHEALSGAEALGLFTTGAAGALREPEPLSVGSPADFVVIDTDPTSASPEEVRSASVIATYVDGVTVAVDRGLPVWADEEAT